MYFLFIFTDPPIVSLNLGSTLSPEDIKEGDDVYFECHIRANPPWSKLTWIHDVRNVYSINLSPFSSLDSKCEYFQRFEFENLHAIPSLLLVIALLKVYSRIDCIFIRA